MECKENQRLTEEYFDALIRQHRISACLRVLRVGSDLQLISVGEQQEEAAIEETFDAWAAVNLHKCTEECEPA